MNCKLVFLVQFYLNNFQIFYFFFFLCSSYGPYSNDLGHLLSPLAGQIIQSDDLQQLTEIIEMKKDLFKKSEKTVQSAFETINFNLDWIDHNVRDTHSRLQDRLRFVDNLQPELGEHKQMAKEEA